MDDFKSGSNPANASLIKRFNQHSTMVLKSCDKKPTNGMPAATGNSTESGGSDVERLSKDSKEVTVNGVHPVTSKLQQNSTSFTPADAVNSNNHEVTDKHVRNTISSVLLIFFMCMISVLNVNAYI